MIDGIPILFPGSGYSGLTIRIEKIPMKRQGLRPSTPVKHYRAARAF